MPERLLRTAKGDYEEAKAPLAAYFGSPPESPERDEAIRLEAVRRAHQGMDDEQLEALFAKVRAEFDSTPIEPMVMPLKRALYEARRAEGEGTTWQEDEGYRLGTPTDALLTRLNEQEGE